MQYLSKQTTSGITVEAAIYPTPKPFRTSSCARAATMQAQVKTKWLCGHSWPETVVQSTNA